MFAVTRKPTSTRLARCRQTSPRTVERHLHLPSFATPIYQAVCCSFLLRRSFLSHRTLERPSRVISITCTTINRLTLPRWILASSWDLRRRRAILLLRKTQEMACTRRQTRGKASMDSTSHFHPQRKANSSQRSEPSPRKTSRPPSKLPITGNALSSAGA